jgi:hypothetical protein
MFMMLDVSTAVICEEESNQKIGKLLVLGKVS